MHVDILEVEKEKPRGTVWMDLEQGQAFIFKCHYHDCETHNKNTIHIRTPNGFTNLRTGWYSQSRDLSPVYVVDISEMQVNLDLDQ